MGLYEKRKAAGLSQSQLAKAANLKLDTLQKYEQGYRDIEKAQSGIVLRLARACGCNMEELLPDGVK